MSGSSIGVQMSKTNEGRYSGFENGAARALCQRMFTASKPRPLIGSVAHPDSLAASISVIRGTPINRDYCVRHRTHKKGI